MNLNPIRMLIKLHYHFHKIRCGRWFSWHCFIAAQFRRFMIYFLHGRKIERDLEAEIRFVWCEHANRLTMSSPDKVRNANIDFYSFDKREKATYFSPTKRERSVLFTFAVETFIERYPFIFHKLNVCIASFSVHSIEWNTFSLRWQRTRYSCFYGGIKLNGYARAPTKAAERLTRIYISPKCIHCFYIESTSIRMCALHARQASFGVRIECAWHAVVRSVRCGASYSLVWCTDDDLRMPHEHINSFVEKP